MIRFLILAKGRHACIYIVKAIMEGSTRLKMLRSLILAKGWHACYIFPRLMEGYIRFKDAQIIDLSKRASRMTFIYILIYAFRVNFYDSCK